MSSKSRSRQKTIQRDDDASEPYSDELNVSSPEVLEMGDEGEVVRSSDWSRKKTKTKRVKEANAEENDQEDADNLTVPDGDDFNDDWESEENKDEDENEVVKRKLSTVSFESLARAQDSLPTQNKKRKCTEHDDETEEKLAALQKRLKEIQQHRKTTNAVQKTAQQEEEGGDSDSQSDMDSDENERKKGRSSKHAPTSLSSTRAVTRKRQVLHVPKATARDPRFDAVTGHVDREKHRKDYAFLDSYIDSEIKEIKDVLKSQKTSAKGSKKKKAKGTAKLTPEDIELLKRELRQKESKRATQEARDRRMDVIREHKKQEKELVRMGKKPFFLKNSHVQKQVLVNKFEGMSEGKREKTIEKKRRKVTAKGRRNMPDTRRGLE